MVMLTSLWLQVLLSAVAVFIASSIIHMVLKYHANDFKKAPDEDGIMAALRPFNLPPGEYCIPRTNSMKEMKDPAYIEKLNKGPVLLMNVLPNGPFNMGKSLGLWFVYCIVASIFAGYIAGRALGPGAPYLEVFRFAGTTAFVGYTLAIWQGAIWYKRTSSTVIKQTIDGLIYGCLTGGVFGAMWPGM